MIKDFVKKEQRTARRKAVKPKVENNEKKSDKMTLFWFYVAMLTLGYLAGDLVRDIYLITTLK